MSHDALSVLVGMDLAKMLTLSGSKARIDREVIKQGQLETKINVPDGCYFTYSEAVPDGKGTLHMTTSIAGMEARKEISIEVEAVIKVRIRRMEKVEQRVLRAGD